MIVYDLKCSQGHGFEEWFDSFADYDAKAAAGAVPCPECGDTDVNKDVMAPNINTGPTVSEPAPACGAAGCANAPMCPMAGRG